MIKIKKDKRYTSTDRVCKLLQKFNKIFFRDNAFTERVVEKESTVRIRN